MGSTLLAKEEEKPTTIEALIEKLDNIDETMLASEDTLDPLFADENDRNGFRHRHYINKVRKMILSGMSGMCI